MAKVSVIIPVYNVEKYLQECIDSLINQTLDDIELIFVNDKSPDNSLAILVENQKKHPDKIIVIDSPVNLRQGGARNLGIVRATAEYIGFVDSDDFVGPNMYRSLYEKIVQTGADAVFISAAIVGMNTRYSLELVSDPQVNSRMGFNAQTCKKFEGVQLNTEKKMDFIATLFSPSVWSGLYKKSILLENDLWFPEHLKFEDNYWCSLMRCYLSTIAVAEGVGYYYRYNENSTTHKKNSTDIDHRCRVEHMMLEAAQERGVLKEYYSAWEYLYAYRYGINTFLAYIALYDDIPYDKLKALQDDVNQNFPKWKNNKYICKTSGLNHKMRLFAFNLNPHSMWGRFCMKLIAWYFNRKAKRMAE